jgi:hypothetical protein
VTERPPQYAQPYPAQYYPQPGQAYYPYGQPVVADPYMATPAVIVEQRPIQTREVVYVDNYNNGVADATSAMACCCLF